jgi:ribulose-phosphate 3-epimerase
VSLVPSTPLVLIEELLPLVDQVLVMTVNPGFGGQKLIVPCLEKARRLAQIRKERGLSFLIAADGGINETTAKAVRDAGVDVLIAGSAFFNAPDKALVVRQLRGR